MLFSQSAPFFIFASYAALLFVQDFIGICANARMMFTIAFAAVIT